MKRHPHRSIILSGRPTSLKLETEFWCYLREVAVERQLTLTQLIEAVERAKSPEASLASALRIFVATHFRAAAS
jgi:predicted DNA-binding ribbon-helix-helix protein